MLIQDFIVELSQIGIPYDNVDESFIKKVRKWDIKAIGRFMVIFGVISAKMIWLWIKVCNLFMKTSIRANEYVADKFAYKIGYGKSLAMALDNINFDIASENGFIQALNSTHPNTNERIARLQSMGVNYNAYSL